VPSFAASWHTGERELELRRRRTDARRLGRRELEVIEPPDAAGRAGAREVGASAATSGGREPGRQRGETCGDPREIRETGRLGKVDDVASGPPTRLGEVEIAEARTTTDGRGQIDLSVPATSTRRRQIEIEAHASTATLERGQIQVHHAATLGRGQIHHAGPLGRWQVEVHRPTAPANRR